MPAGSPKLFPTDHARALVELMRPAGPDLARRWLAALLLVPAGERVGIVEAIERSIVREFGHLRPFTAPPAIVTGQELDEPAAQGAPHIASAASKPPRRGRANADPNLKPSPAPEPRTVRVARPPIQRHGYTEQVFTDYEVRGPAAAPSKPPKSAAPVQEAEAKPATPRRKRG